MGVKPMVLRGVVAAGLLGAAALLGWAIVSQWPADDAGSDRGGGAGPIPVQTAAIETGPITLRRTFSGTLEAQSRSIVAPKVGGRIETLAVDLADPVTRGQVVAELDNAEFVQAVNVAEAELEVARANLTEAQSAREIASRGLDRIRTLRERGVASDVQFDSARSDELAQEAAVAVAQAELTRAEAALRTARIRLGYTRVTADWSGGGDRRVVAQRYVNAGDTAAANAPLLAIVALDPITGVIFVTERDYARLQPGQPVRLTTDAYPGETFEGRISRVAPVFQEGSRQARVELTIPNPDRRLKPGMFVRATAVLRRIEDARIVPAMAVTRRGDRDGVFMLDDAAMAARWHPVAVGIREGDRVQILAEGLSGRVITLGQQMVDDGSPVTVSGGPADAAGEGAGGG